ncbi:MAG: arylsulfatase [Planctomycetales bacterium]|nr:arylsulfatase [Planctomycetales bacterium]
MLVISPFHGWPRCFAAIALLFFASATSAAALDTRPNIVLIMADDLGFADLGCYGSEIETPHLDRLARQGLRFTQFYNTAKCHSSRVSLLTGLYCGQAGDESMRRGVTIAEALRPAGYFTAMSGKWHLQREPTDRGFERYFGHLSGATNFFTGDTTFRLNGQPWSNFGEHFYTTDAMTDFAIRFIDEARQTDRPFFTYLAYNAPHYPLQAPRAEVEKYLGRYDAGWDKLRVARHRRQLEMGLLPAKWALSPRPDHVPAWKDLSADEQQWESRRMAVFAAMVDRLDQNIGRLIAHLEKSGELENTLLLFCSDNGACPFERTRGRQYDPWDARAYWTYDTGWAHVGNTPFRLYKQNQHEGGISSPLIVHWPAGLKTKPGALTDQPGHLIDLMATCVELGQADYPRQFDGRAIDPLMGQSLAPIFRGQVRTPHEQLYFRFGTDRALREGDWKLVSAKGGRWELYNLADDRTELHDLAAEYPERVQQMKAAWHALAADVDRLSENNRKPVSQELKTLFKNRKQAK